LRHGLARIRLFDAAGSLVRHGALRPRPTP
jgi:hypothetical protein